MHEYFPLPHQATSPATNLPPVFSFWDGPLSWLERLSIASFIRNGHDFTLYGFERPVDLPEGCRWSDASEVVPREEMFFYKENRTPATFADYFRLLLMQQNAGIWADCDMICLRPFTGLPDHIFGMEVQAGRGAHGGQINNAVLRIPSESPLLASLIGIFDTDGTQVDPVWLPLYRRLEVLIRRVVGQKVGLSHMQFGATGPFPLTYFARQHGLDRYACSPDVFYPLPYRDARVMLRAGSELGPYLTENTLGVHLWRMALTGRSRQPTPFPPEPGSVLAHLAAELELPIPLRG